MDNFDANILPFDINSLSSNPMYNFTNCFNSDSDTKISFFSSTDGFPSPYESVNINCEYSSCTNIISDDKLLTVLSLNIQSINAKFNEFNDLINVMTSNGCCPDIICLQELWQFPNDRIFELTNYQPLQHRCRSDGVQGGGVGIFVRKGLDFIIEPILSVFHDRVFETLFVEISLNGKKIIIGSIYRPNSGHPNLNSSEQFDFSMDLLANLLDNITDRNLTAFLFGDFNLDILKYGTCSKVSFYIDLVFSHGFIQTITKPTRCSGNSATVIDHCITNSTNMSHDSSILTTLLSDHFPVFYNIKNVQKKISNKYMVGRVLSDSNIEKFKDGLKTLNWDFLYTLKDTQEAYDYFSDTFFSLYDIYLPVQTKRFNINYCKIDPWFTTGLLVSRRQKIRLDKIAAKSRLLDDVAKYKNYRNLYNKIVRKAKSLYFEKQLLLNQSNMKKTWQLLRCAINKKTKNAKHNLSCILHDNKLLTQPSEIAKALNLHFSEAPSKIVEQVNPVNDFTRNSLFERTADRQPVNSVFRSADLQISHEEIFAALKLLETKKIL